MGPPDPINLAPKRRDLFRCHSPTAKRATDAIVLDNTLRHVACHA
jgi:hypothetical protein